MPKIEELLTVGEYTITRYHDDDYWIEHDSGEAMQVNKKAMEDLINNFYKDNF